MDPKQILQNTGLKSTNQRIIILKILNKTNKPLSAYEIKDMLESENINLNISTVYRVLEKLSEHKLIHKINHINSYKPCQLDNTHHHSFLVCNTCNKVEEFESRELCKMEDSITKILHFKPLHQGLEILGTCSSCQ